MGWQNLLTATTVLVALHIGFSVDVRVFDSCSNSTDCPENSDCLPRNCDGNVCVCRLGYVPSSGRDKCYIATILNAPCDDVGVLCRARNAICSERQCQCGPSYVPAADNLRCKLKPILSLSFALLDETCDGVSVICETTFLRCDTGQQRCVCIEGWRPATEDELNAQPFMANECRILNFSLNTPVEDLDCPVPVPPVSSRVGEPCISFNNCPEYSDCLPRGCDGDVCVCQRGLYPSNNRTSCRPVSMIGEGCDDNTVCYGEERGSRCDNGRCACSEGSIQSHDGRCKPEPETGVEFAMYGEECGTVSGSKRVACFEERTSCSSAIGGRCVCRREMRQANQVEITRDPFNPSPCRLIGYQLEAREESLCEREEMFRDCLDWERDQPFWRKWFKRDGRSRGQGQGHPGWDWVTAWRKHRDRLRNCSKLEPLEDGDNWSEEFMKGRKD